MASSHLSSFRRSVRRRGLRLTRRCTPICESRETIRRTGASHLRSGVLGRKPMAHSRSAPGMSSRRMSGTWGSRGRQAWALSSVKLRAYSRYSLHLAACAVQIKASLPNYGPMLRFHTMVTVNKVTTCAGRLDAFSGSPNGKPRWHSGDLKRQLFGI